MNKKETYFKQLQKKMQIALLSLFAIAFSFTSCDFFADGVAEDNSNSLLLQYLLEQMNKQKEQMNKQNVEITSLKLSGSNVSVQVGGIAYLGFSTVPQVSIKPSWTYETEIIEITENANGIVIKGLKEGETALTCTYQNQSATAIIKVSGFADTYVDTTEPYIYSNTTILQLKPGEQDNVYVSLYNGTVADIDSYKWSIENPAVAEISPTGQYCQIKALTKGYSRVKVTNSKSQYPYYIGVYVLEDFEKAAFISTSDDATIYKCNVNEGEKTIHAKLRNPATENYEKDFKWTLTDGTDFLSIESNGESCVLVPKKAGTAYIQVSHPQAEFPLDITVRVVEIVENVYVQPNTTTLILNGLGENTGTISASLVGISEGKEYSNDDFYFEVEQETDSRGEGRFLDYTSFANQITFTGKHNGSAVVYIGHPKAAKKRQVLVIAENQTADAADASCVISTTQNYVKTKVGADETVLQISMKGGTEEDNRNFVWNVTQQPLDGSSNVIELTTADGLVNDSRSAANVYTYAEAHIKPLSVGTATITITNSKSYYPLEILVKVLDANAILEDQYYFTGPGIVKFLNNETYSYTVSLHKAPEAQKTLIQWTSDNPQISIAASGEEAEFSSTASGSNISHITVNHINAQSPKEICVLTADTQEELDAIKAFYSDKMYYSVNVESDSYIYVDQVGFTDDNGMPFDFNSVASQVVWTSSDPLIATVERTDNPLVGKITGVKAGVAKITIQYGETKAVFTVTVYPKGVEIGQVESTIYLTTSNNVVIFPETGITKTVEVSPLGLQTSKYKDIKWECDNTDIATVIGNGEKATITAIKEGEAVIHVSHEDSENTLKIHVRVGSEYVIVNGSICRLAASTDTVLLTTDSPTYKLTAALVNAENESDGLTGFNFSIDDESVAKITTQFQTGSCYIKPVAKGQAEITITHSKAIYPKKVLVIVGNTAEELAEITYLKTNSPVIYVGQGQTKEVSVSVANSSESVISGYSWTSNDPGIASIKNTNGATALVSGNEIGITEITVKNTSVSKYDLNIIVKVIDPVTASDYPFIEVPDPIINLVESTSWTTLKASLIGGKDGDDLNFLWSTYDSDVLELYSQNGVAKVRAKKAGIATISVNHPKSVYPQDIRVICEAAAATEYSISVSGGNIVSIRPDSGDHTITASLVNGSTTDQYNFKWSLDVYDIIDLTYSANTAVITPLKQGTVTLTVSHPKAAYDQQIKIKVQQYDNFSFGSVSKFVTVGQSTFIQMEVPASSTETYIRYSSLDTSVATISGTNAVCQITGTASTREVDATTTVTAELIEKRKETVIAKADLLVVVKPSAQDLIYIRNTDALASTFVMQPNTTKIISAELAGTGVSILDNANLLWTTKPNDEAGTEISDVVVLANTNSTGWVSGNSVHLTAKKSGDCTLRIKHEKAASELVFHIIVPAEEASEVTIDKSYLKLERGKTGELHAKVSSGKTADYKNLVWSIDKFNGKEIARLNGSSEAKGESVTITGVKAGQATITCILPETGSKDTCTLDVEDPRSLTFSRETLRLPPGEKNCRTFKYTVSPPDATLTWTTAGGMDGEDFFEYSATQPDANGEGTVTVTGLKEGSAPLQAVTSYGNKARINIQIAWDYTFKLDQTKISRTIAYGDKIEIGYSVCPADVEITGSNDAAIKYYLDYEIYSPDPETGRGKIIISPLKEAAGKDLKLIARNPSFSTSTVSSSSSYTEVIGEATLNCTFSVPSYTPYVRKVSLDGKYSSIDPESEQKITMGDGEQMTVVFGVKQSQADIKNISAKFTVANQYNTLQNEVSTLYPEEFKSMTFSNAHELTSESCGNNEFQILIDPICSDLKKEGYNVTWATVPTYNGNRISLDRCRWCDPTKEEQYVSSKKFGCIIYYHLLCIDGHNYFELGDYTKNVIYGYYEQDSTDDKYKIERSLIYDPYISYETDYSLCGCYSEEEFESKAYWFDPASKTIMSQFVSAYKGCSTNSALATGLKNVAGCLNIQIIHNDGTNGEMIPIQIYLEIRECACN